MQSLMRSSDCEARHFFSCIAAVLPYRKLRVGGGALGWRQTSGRIARRGRVKNNFRQEAALHTMEGGTTAACTSPTAARLPPPPPPWYQAPPPPPPQPPSPPLPPHSTSSPLPPSPLRGGSTKPPSDPKPSSSERQQREALLSTRQHDGGRHQATCLMPMKRIRGRTAAATTPPKSGTSFTWVRPHRQAGDSTGPVRGHRRRAWQRRYPCCRRRAAAAEASEPLVTYRLGRL